MEVVHARSNRQLCTLRGLSASSTVRDVKRALGLQRRRYQDVNRQELRLEPKGKGLNNEDTLQKLGVGNGAMLYFKVLSFRTTKGGANSRFNAISPWQDRGLQIGWKTVFLTEYSGPLMVYLWIYTRPWLLYGDDASKPYNTVVKLVQKI